MVAKSGFFLGIADMALASSMQNKGLLVLYYDNDPSQPQLTTFVAKLKAMVEGAEAPSGFPSPELNDCTAWCAAACSADYQKRNFQNLNHWVPLFRKSVMGVEMWETLAEG